ncbi:MAG: hypothetical protein HC820_00680 [Hydrococcus sp. RM1_1_31]|nr:hypothetical protein [Hydrococcus sp. RM1_1_31]
MSSHLKLKSLTFYGVAIASVLTLFKVVSAYGENHLKAPPAISGQYRLIKTQNLADCLKDLKTLKIEQSGIYLIGKLSFSEREIVLDGKLNGKQIFLSTKTEQIAQCQAKDSANLFTIEGQTKDKIFSGKMIWNSAFPETNFTAKLEEIPTQQPETH